MVEIPIISVLTALEMFSVRPSTCESSAWILLAVNDLVEVRRMSSS